MTHSKFNILRKRCEKIQKSKIKKVAFLALFSITILSSFYVYFSIYWQRKPMPLLNESPQSIDFSIKTTTIQTHLLKSSEEENLQRKFAEKSTLSRAYNLAYFYFDTQNYTQAILFSQKAIELNPKHEPSWILYAKANFYLGKKNEAIRSLEIYLSRFNTKESQELLAFYKGQQ